MIKIEALRCSYGDLEVLKGVSAEIEKGEVISIIGPSGCGKSTFLRCLNLLEQPDSGSIRVDGLELLAPGVEVAKIRQRMNMVFQSFNLFEHMTVRENLTLAPVKLRGMSRRAADEKALELLRTVGLAERADHLPRELSGGQKQRVAIARCLAMDPDIILLDEPTSALDPTMVGEVLAVIRNLAERGLTLLIVTHEMDFAREVSSRVFYMHQGKIHEAGPPDAMFDQPVLRETRAFVKMVKSCHLNIESSQPDLFALHSQIESFCQKHLLGRKQIHQVQLLVEELMVVLTPELKLGSQYRMEIEYIQGQRTVQVNLRGLEGTNTVVGRNTMPLFGQSPPAGEDMSEDLSATLILNLVERLEFKEDAGGAFEFLMKKPVPD